MLEVKSQQCDQCLFSKNRIVSSKRMKDILQGCARKDTHFICHKATIENKDVVCRGFFDNRTSQLIRIAGRLNAIKFI